MPRDDQPTVTGTATSRRRWVLPAVLVNEIQPRFAEAAIIPAIVVYERESGITLEDISAAEDDVGRSVSSTAWSVPSRRPYRRRTVRHCR